MNDSVVKLVAVVCFFSMMRTEMECIDVIPPWTGGCLIVVT
jgi:hypothetical protein